MKDLNLNIFMIHVQAEQMTEEQIFNCPFI